MHQIADKTTARRFYLLLLACLAIMISACAGQKTKQEPEPGSPTENQNPTPQTVAEFTQWNLKGKLGVRSPKENGSANLAWLQGGAENFRLHLSGPLGAGTTVITGSAGGVSLVRGSEPPIYARNPAQLTQEALGWPLPAREMFYWVRGLPAPGAKSGEQRNAQGQLQSLQQSGWALSFSEYRSEGSFMLPTRIKAQTNSPTGPVSVTLVIKDWGL
ncbi:lipoprotein insertase outer membrane protein LolB [Microbulbifer sp. VAAF005]|uniref:lipoprotein insertase outer membrane protein LolB n=1 Tax=Microbulbifer sp. VAAF005 TaxID=3034230 RepID=UPI0024ACCE9F|nr:lipoprotein insertase outer membrane protein LolB [Microbulbifer sp. VAAF005]WHI48363.1 lipoprotein insertase outer membrane protein LolB [Microbulbifer sp. VAAF005]